MVELVDGDGPFGPPRSNGELVFSAPWQSRVFAVAVALHEAGRLDWDQFRDELVVQLAGTTDASPDTYWAAWLRATEKVVADHDLVPGEEAEGRLATYAARPRGHDHGDHDHGDHDHGDHGDHDHRHPG